VVSSVAVLLLCFCFFAAVFFPLDFPLPALLLLCFFLSMSLSLLSCCCFITALLFCCCSFAFYSLQLCCTVSAFSAGFSLDFEGGSDIERKVAAGNGRLLISH
jgi:hypothetical protein